MAKIKNQQWDHKIPIADRDAVFALAAHGPHANREMGWVRAVATAASVEKHNDKSGARNYPTDFNDHIAEVVRQMGEAAITGDWAAFKRMTAVVKYLKETGGLSVGAIIDRAWVDPLFVKIMNYHAKQQQRTGGATGEQFNIDKFIRDTECDADRKTITFRVRAMGLRVATGRPPVSNKRPTKSVCQPIIPGWVNWLYTKKRK
ncbi:MAG: hypothetical protein EXS42_04390 [Lacunisphaera sp.]|nr:hypothetical protein [Lacunisphaera sp.]